MRGGAPRTQGRTSLPEVWDAGDAWDSGDGVLTTSMRRQVGAHVVVTSGRTYAVVVASQGRDVVASQDRDVVASQGRGRDVRDGDGLTIWTPRWWSMGLDRDGWLRPEVAWVLVRGADDHGCGGTTDPRQPETSLSR